MEIRTDRVGLLVEQLESSRDFSRARLEGLTDDEFLWEPATGAWSVRRREDVAPDQAFGTGDWVLQQEQPEPQPAPLTTIAWRLGHLYACFLGRWDWTFGTRSLTADEIEFSPHAAEAQERFWAIIDRWIESVEAMTDEQLDMIGFGQFPEGLDPHIPFIGIVWWNNREFIHHMAEIALLRDLYAARGSGA